MKRWFRCVLRWVMDCMMSHGCQEFGWLILDGLPLREDISLVAAPQAVTGGSYRWRPADRRQLSRGDQRPSV